VIEVGEAVTPSTASSTPHDRDDPGNSRDDPDLPSRPMTRTHSRVEPPPYAEMARRSRAMANRMREDIREQSHRLPLRRR
jgi:hypothetical protein